MAVKEEQVGKGEAVSSAKGQSESKGDGDFDSQQLEDPKSKVWPQYCAAAMACCVSVVNGCSYGWPSVAEAPLSAAGALDANVSSWLASLMYLTSALAVLPSAWLSPKYGRKTMGYLAGGCLAVQWLLLCAAAAWAEADAELGLETGIEAEVEAGTLPWTEVPSEVEGVAWSGARQGVGVGVLLLLARAFAGGAAALLFYFTPAYIREVSTDRVRGTLGTFMSLFFNCGVLVVYAAGALLPLQGVHLLCLALNVLYLVGIWRMPETPSQLLALGRRDEARVALQWLRGARADVHREFCALEGVVKRRREEESTSLKGLLADRASAKGLALAIALCANQPLCGFFVVISYAVPIFREASPSFSSGVASSVVGMLLALGSLAAGFYVERLGRRALMLISDVVLAVCLTVLGAHAYAQSQSVDVSGLWWLPVVALSVFMFAVSLAVTTLPFVIITEMFLPQAQALATLVGAIIILMLGFLATKFFPDLNAALGLHGTYWLFAASCAAFAVYYFMQLPETKGRSLESIRRELAGEVAQRTPKETV